MGAERDCGGVQCDGNIDTPANAAVVALLRKQVAAGDHHGVAVAAFLNGVPIVHAWAGPGVHARTLFMGASVAKGCTAAALAVLHSRGLLDYTARVSSVWPDFQRNGKGDVTVEQALSHRAGLYASMPRPGIALRLLCRHYLRGWRAMSDAGCSWLAALTPDWSPGTWAAYHPVSWSWIVIGICQGCTGRHIRDVFAEEVASPLDSATCMHLGVLPQQERRRVLLMVRPSAAQLWRSSAGAAVGLLRVMRFLAAWLEALVMVTIFNANVFSAVCLPSSNGFWTAIAVARLYGALANGGSVQLPDSTSSVELFDAAKLAALHHKVRTDARVASPEGETAQNSLGFSPWPHLCAGADTDSLVLGHGGMGGSVAWADVDRGLSVAVLRSSYSPISLGACAATRELAECIRAHAPRVGGTS